MRDSAYCEAHGSIVIYLSLYMPNHTFTLIGSHDILEDRCIDDITVKSILVFYHIQVATDHR